jgi:hypothetical protein
MDLLDAMCSNTFARSPVELSLVPAFRRGWSSIYDAVDAFFAPKDIHSEEAERAELEQRLRRVVAPVLDAATDCPFWLFAVDATPLSRPHARTLDYRAYVHQDESVPGQKPVTVGHAYSLVTALGERPAGTPPWSVSLSARRIPWQHTPQKVAAQQLKAIVGNRSLPWSDDLSVVVADSHYSCASFLEPLADCGNLVSVTRLRSNRVLFCQPPERVAGQRGAPKKYGLAFRLKQPGTWGEAATTTQFQIERGGRELTVTLQAWPDLILKHEADGHACTQTVNVIRAAVQDADGKWVYNRDLWLAMAGDRRGEITGPQAFAAYDRRFDQEHCHRFLRQRLLMDACQTPVAQHEENWLMLVTLAYAQLYAARDLAQNVRRPWEPRRTTEPAAVIASPTMVQRDFARILATTGTPAAPPKPRGKTPGRATGQSPGRRIRRPVARTHRKAA